MQKKLLVVAVAGALFSPLAMAQSSVTISGVFKVGVDNIRLSGATAARAGHNSENRITDNSSRIIFGITEDMGGGLSAIAQLDVRPQLDDAGETNVASGNSWVGVRSTTLGTLTFGRHDLHYGKQPDDTSALAGALMASSTSLMDYIGPVAIANATRTPNVIRWDSPNWSGFAATVAYSTNPITGAGAAATLEADLGSAVRKGNAWNFNPSYTSGPFQIGASVWRAKADGAVFDQDSLSLYGYYRFGAFKVGLGINDSEFETAAGVVNDRRAWTVPVSWTAGAHNVAGHFTRAGEDKGTVASDDASRMIAVSYTYSLSKRTAMGVTFAKITNETNAAYNFFTNVASLGSTGSTLTAGEDGRLMAFTVRHAF